MVKHNFKIVGNDNPELTEEEEKKLMEEDKNEKISLERQKSEKYLQHLKEIKRNKKRKGLTPLGHYRVWVNLIFESQTEVNGVMQKHDDNTHLIDDFKADPITMKISFRPIKQMLNILSNLKLFRG